jgi:hypothetical protein
MNALGDTRRISDRILSLLGLRLVLWLLVSATLIPHLLIHPFAVTDHYDEHYFYAHDDAARISILDYHQIPAWNPYYCGGIPLAANPQDGCLAPDFWLRLFYGTGPGRRLTVLLFLLLGMEGTYQLARKHASSTLAAATGAVIFAASGRFFFMLEFGWVNMFGFDLLPWVFVGYELGLKSFRWRILGGFALGWMLLAGGTYSTPYTVLVIAALTLYDTLAIIFRPALDPGDGTKWWRPIWSAAGVGFFTALFSAAKFLPMLAVVSQHPRTIHNTYSNNFIQMMESLVTSHSEDPQGIAAEGYVGLLVAALALVSLLTKDRRAVRFMTMVGVFFALGMGDQGKTSLWTMVRSLPLYSQLRDPQRFSMVISFFLALAVARSLTAIEDLPGKIAHSLLARFQAWRRKIVSEQLPFYARIVTGAIGAVAVVMLGYLTCKLLVLDDRMHQTPFTQDPPLAAKQDFHQARGNRWDAQVWAPAGRGTLQCFEETAFDQSPALRGDLAKEEFSADATTTVDRISWTPNRIKVHVHATSETSLTVNQNFAKGWSSSVGNVDAVNGELTVAQIPAGDHDVELRYDDRALDVGILISIATTFGAAALFVAWSKKRIAIQIESARSISSPNVGASRGVDSATITATPELSASGARRTEGSPLTPLPTPVKSASNALDKDVDDKSGSAT